MPRTGGLFLFSKLILNSVRFTLKSGSRQTRHNMVILSSVHSVHTEHTYVHTHACTHAHTYTHVCTQSTHARTQHTYVHAHTHIHMCLHTAHMHTTHMHTHVHTYTHPPVPCSHALLSCGAALDSLLEFSCYPSTLSCPATLPHPTCPAREACAENPSL